MSSADAILMLNAHLDYLGRVDDFLKGAIPDPRSSKPTDCVLGKWYYNVSEPAIKQHPHYAALGETHLQFHAITETAIQLYRSGKIEEAQQKLSEAFTLYSQISNILMEFDDVLA